MPLLVCFISRGFSVTHFGIIDGGEKFRVCCPDNGTPRVFCGGDAPAEYLAAINSFELDRHRTTPWPDHLGPRPEHVVRFPDAGFAEDVQEVSPYGAFI